MKIWLSLLTALATSTSVPAWAQDATPISDEVRELVDELQAGEQLTPPTETADRPAAAGTHETA